jgi:biotin carboxyl carrier protein
MQILSPMPGSVLKILVKEGDAVKEGDDVIVLESMKMENYISTKSSGTVKEIKVSEQDKVASKTVLMIID